MLVYSNPLLQKVTTQIHYKQNSKISGIQSLHHFIPAVVIIIENYCIKTYATRY